MATMIVVPEPSGTSRAALRNHLPGPILARDGDEDLHCGHCGGLVIKGVTPRDVEESIFQCNRCESYNMPEVAATRLRVPSVTDAPRAGDVVPA